MYLITTPWWLRAFYPSFRWSYETNNKELYLTFDDGPHPEATPFLLDELKKYNAKATFFCIGKNVVAHPDIYQRIIDDGHRTGNHTFNHLNGWKTDNKTYIDNVFEAAKFIDSDLFRPPYGRISKFQAKLLQKQRQITFPASPLKIIMWSVLSGDFDTNLSPEKCLNNVILNAKPGAVIVFHDSAKAWERLQYAVPRVLEYFSERGYAFKAIN